MRLGYKIVGLVVMAGLMSAGCAKQGAFAKRPEHYPTKRLRSSYDVPIVINDSVRKWIDRFKQEYRPRFTLYLSRSGRYESFMRGILTKEGLPQDLVYLALIESGFSNHAYSRARAVGPWQFIRSTARIYGLKINSWVDERRDPKKSTQAAARYLKDLYREFGDWYLAMAAYNAGEGRIHKAVLRSGSRNFWELSSPGTRYLKEETKNYISKFLAAALIAKSPKHFGFETVHYEKPLSYEEVPVKGPLDLEVAAFLAGSDTEELKQLNPELKRGLTPHETYHLKIPSGTQSQFRLAYAKLPPKERVRVVYYRVGRAESLSKIARRYGISTHSLIAANGLTQKGSRHLKAGTRLVIPKEKEVSSGILLAQNDSKSRARKRTNGVAWLIRKDMGGNENEEVQETMDVSEIKEVEEESSPRSISKPVLDKKGAGEAALPSVLETDLGGEPIKTVVIEPKNAKPAQEKKVHVVKRGDNLWKIAKRYKVNISDLKQWNNLSSPKNIRPGKTLIVSSPSYP